MRESTNTLAPATVLSTRRIASKTEPEGKLLIKVHYLGWRDVWDEEVRRTSGIVRSW